MGEKPVYLETTIVAELLNLYFDSCTLQPHGSMEQCTFVEHRKLVCVQKKTALGPS